MNFIGRRSRKILLREMRIDGYVLRAAPTNCARYFIDIGASIGFVSLAAWFMHPRMRITCVEPAPETFACLQSNTAGMCFRLINAALGPAGTRADVTSGTSVLGVTYGQVAGGPVPCMDLPEIFVASRARPENTWLKVDCEGGEATLVGDLKAEALLKRCRISSWELHSTAGRHYDKYLEWLRAQLGQTHTEMLIHRGRHLCAVNYVRRDTYPLFRPA